MTSDFPVLAQTGPTVPPRSLEPQRPIPPLPVTPPVQQFPSPLVPPSSPPTRPPSPSGDRLRVERIEVVGSTVFSQAELAAVVRPYEQRELTFEELLEIRSAVTRLYTDRGYTTSGAILLPQAIADGVVRIQAVEGDLEQIEVRGLNNLRPGYVRDRLTLAARRPLNIPQLEAALQLLQLDPLFSSVKAELIAGSAPGRSALIVTLKEAAPVNYLAQIDNRNSPSVGSFGGVLGLGSLNLSGLGDRFNLELSKTAGVNQLALGYDVPLTPRDARLNLNLELSSTRIIEEPFESLNIGSRGFAASLGLRQPLLRTPTTEIGVGASLDLRYSKTLLDDLPFSFSLGPEAGESQVAVLRLTQDWVDRTPTRVFAARSQFSKGMDALGATVNNTGVDGRFFSWLGQFQWVQALNQSPNSPILITRFATQLTGDALLPLEQISVGGIDTVRGYRQNQRVGDSGILGSVELRLPLVRDLQGIGTIQLIPFFDVGSVWVNRAAIETPSFNRQISSPQTLASLGLGVRWQRGSQFSARLDWGIPLIKVNQEKNSLQDSGVTFAVQYRFF